MFLAFRNCCFLLTNEGRGTTVVATTLPLRRGVWWLPATPEVDLVTLVRVERGGVVKVLRIVPVLVTETVVSDDRKDEGRA